MESYKYNDLSKRQKSYARAEETYNKILANLGGELFFYDYFIPGQPTILKAEDIYKFIKLIEYKRYLLENLRFKVQRLTYLK